MSSERAVMRADKTNMFCWQLLNLKLMWTEREGTGMLIVTSQQVRGGNKHKWKRNRSIRLDLICQPPTPTLPTIGYYFSLLLFIITTQINKYLILKIIKRNIRVMNVSMQGEGTYCMEWIALINWNLEVSLELVKSCNLQGRKGKEMIIWSVKYRDNNLHILLWKVIIILSSAAWQ